jgi:hypothetical protein
MSSRSRASSGRANSRPAWTCSVGPAFIAALTAYDQHTRDVLTPGTADPYQPYGGVAQMGLANRGVEASVRARLVERPGLGAELGLRAWGARNRVRNLDSPAWFTQTPTGISQVVRDGASLGAYTGAPGAPRARDYNGDGLVTSADAARALAASAPGAGHARRRRHRQPGCHAHPRVPISGLGRGSRSRCPPRG